MRIALVAAVLCATASAQGSKGSLMHATGTFNVKVLPADPSDIAKAADTGRMTIDKTWTGALTGTSKGEMLTGITTENASMAYVAMERFTGTVDGHAGTFLFSHTAEMLNNAPTKFDVTIVPGSGTAALKGLTGKLAITIADKVHTYDLAYELTTQQ